MKSRRLFPSQKGSSDPGSPAGRPKTASAGALLSANLLIGRLHARRAIHRSLPQPTATSPSQFEQTFYLHHTEIIGDSRSLPAVRHDPILVVRSRRQVSALVEHRLSTALLSDHCSLIGTNDPIGAMIVNGITHQDVDQPQAHTEHTHVES